jgi:hypothetical protein
VPHANVVLFDARVGFHGRVKLRIFLEVKKVPIAKSNIQAHQGLRTGH